MYESKSQKVREKLQSLQESNNEIYVLRLPLRLLRLVFWSRWLNLKGFFSDLKNQNIPLPFTQTKGNFWVL